MASLAALDQVVRNWLSVRTSKAIVIWPHLGLGDAIGMARFFEKLDECGVVGHVPCKERNLNTLVQMFSYLPNLRWHPISNDPNLEEREVANLKEKLALPVVVGGRMGLQLVRAVFPWVGLNTALMISCGYWPPSLSSNRLQRHLLNWDQIEPPEGPYLFFNRRTSLGSRNLEKELASSSLAKVEERADVPIQGHVKLMVNATEIWSVGSAFLSLALVLDLQAERRIFFSSERLLSDDRQGLWENKCIP